MTLEEVLQSKGVVAFKTALRAAFLAVGANVEKSMEAMDLCLQNAYQAGVNDKLDDAVRKITETLDSGYTPKKYRAKDK